MPKETFFNLPEEKRARILDVALDAFAAHDYQNVSISSLVEEAGIAKGSFYQYFDGKEDLYRHLLDVAAQEKRRFMQERPPQPEMDIFAYLRWLAGEGVRFELTHPRLAQVAYRALTSDGYPPAFIAALREQGLLYFRQLVAVGKEQGAIAPSIDEDLAAFIFNTIFTELGQYVLRRFPERARRYAGGPGGFNTFFQGEEVQALFDQTLSILEDGMGNRNGEQ